MKSLLLFLFSILIISACNTENKIVHELSREDAVQSYKDKCCEGDQSDSNYPWVWKNGFNDCPDEGTQCKLFIEEEDGTADFQEAIDNGLASVASYFNSSYVVLFPELEGTNALTNLQNGTLTAIYIPETDYSATLDTSQYYFYLGDTSVIDLVYENNVVTDVTGYNRMLTVPK